MKLLDVQDYNYEQLFIVYQNNKKREFKIVAIGENGEYILVESFTTIRYFELTIAEVRLYARIALDRNRISKSEYNEIIRKL